ncbi:hypothetical protein [Aurantiacibacter aquimixticola]|uniref:FecR protein domain-containing protein n=1 Tax=Aurantiacibacter aquimixticola TaxID=1958945 RepID=A0A419RS80_9SPHN|nr:hypothetical protein [Aurantiacibacter aquimixticola]RJY08635.1 hypothetical protein D6201_04010 [Aurantiacibacter aquimixticola]
MKITLLSAGLALAMTAPAAAQEVPAPMPLQVQQQDAGNAYLPANTELRLRMNQDVTTRGNSWNEGDTFNLTVSHDVMLGDYVVIPEGSRAVGRITWLTSRGMFGKSGKMDIELEYAEVAGRQIALEGTYRQEGEGNTLATVGGVIVAGVFGGFITGRSAVIPAGRELVATTQSNVELAIPASAIRRAPVGMAEIAPRAGASAAAGPSAPLND